MERRTMPTGSALTPMKQTPHALVLNQRVQGCLLLGLIAIALLITMLYVSQEQTFYSWDYARYANRVSGLAATLKQDPLKALLSVLNSLGDDYSLLPVLPILPFTLLFGDSRMVFMTASMVSYGVPFCLLMGAIASQSIPRARSAVIFWSTAFLTLSIPALAFPIFRGYPDIGGLCLVLWGIRLYWTDPALQRRFQVVQIAGVLAIAVYFRRHFAYSVRAVLLAMVLERLILFWPNLGRGHGEFALWMKTTSKIIQLALFFGLFSIVILIKTLFLNYRLLYSSYEVSLADSSQYYGQAFGGLFWGMAISGYVIGYIKGSVDTPKIRFFLFFSGISILQWFISSKQIGPHYTTHFIAFIIIGLSILNAEILKIQQFFRRLLLLIINGLLLLANARVSLGFNSMNRLPGRFMLAAPEFPLVRQDYATFSHLVKFLREQTVKGESIYIAASSYGLNSSNVLEAERQLYPSGQLSIFKTSDVDSRDYYPLNALLSAQFVVVANPPQFHLAPQEQDLVRIVVDMFHQQWLFAQDFQQLPQQFGLENGVQVVVYKRDRPTSEKVIMQTLQTLLARIQDKPGREPYWLMLNSRPEVGSDPVNPSSLDTNHRKPQRYPEHRYSDIQKDPLLNTVHISGVDLGKGMQKSFLYFGALSQKVQLSGTLNRSKCKALKELSLELLALRPDGSILQAQRITVDFDRSRDFRIPLLTEKAAYLRLNVLAAELEGQPGSCKISLNHLTVKP
jgi:hypothetical protein